MLSFLRYTALFIVIGWLGVQIFNLDNPGLTDARNALSQSAKERFGDETLSTLIDEDAASDTLAFVPPKVYTGMPFGESHTGAFLAARNAAMHGDYHHAAEYISEALPGTENLTEHKQQLLPVAAQYHVLAGNIDAAINMAHASHEYGLETATTRLILFVDAVKRQDVEAMAATSEVLGDRGLSILYTPLVQEWVAWATADSEQATDAGSPSLPDEALASLHAYHTALRHTIDGDATAAAEAFERALVRMEKAPDAVKIAAIRFYAAQGDTARALEIIDAAKETHPRDILWHARASDALLEQLTALDSTLPATIRDGVAEVMGNIGGMLVMQHTLDYSQQLLQLSNWLRDDDVLTQLSLAKVYEERDQYDAAIAHYQMIRTIAPIKENILRYIARSHHANGDTDAARDILLSQRQNGHTRYHLYTMLGDIERADEQHIDAANYYSSAIAAVGELLESDWQLLFRRAVMYDMAGKWEKAEADLQQALMLRPDEPDLLNYLGYSWITHGKHLEKAQTMLKRAISISQSPHIIDSYGWALYHLGKYEAALKQLDTALSELPGDPTINDHYGDALWRVGRENEARFHWQRALEFEPVEPGAEEKLREKLNYGLLEDAEKPAQHSSNHSEDEVTNTDVSTGSPDTGQQ